MANDDSNLVQRFNNGEEAAFNEVYKLYYRQLCFYTQKFSISREESQDVVAECFVSLFKSVQNGKQFHSMDYIKNFLFSITRNAAINHINYSQRQSGYMKDFLKVAEPAEEDLRNQRIEVEMLQIIYTAVESLPAECKRIFKMIYLDGRGYQEIADELNLSPQTVRNQKSRAIQLLRKYILKSNGLVLAGLFAGAIIFVFSLLSSLPFSHQ